ncbi:hypothetical protein EAX61_08990 [Dokdonia sinensis]|uniref:histidine kinase n=1 Tax=Dokdonia sinensis TaxID=2479847 RepID=A0A3M0GCC0_9FLAO|nr:sensor histidine kinase [Dokdonia sinensis]RMB59183.1 hypothetical protein EAX61_08990 [Dokdonia sinensis]
MEHEHSDKIIKSIYTSFFATLSVVVMVAVMYFASQYAQDWVTHTSEVKSTIINLSEKVIKAESLHRGYILTKDEEYRIDYKVEINKIQPIIDVLQSKIQDNDVQMKSLSTLNELINERILIMDENIKSYVVGSASENINRSNRDEVKGLIKSIENLRDTMLMEENMLLEERKSTADLIYIIGLILIIIGLGIMFFSLFMLRKRLFPLFLMMEESNDMLSDMVTSRDEEIKEKEKQVLINEDLLLQMEDKNKQLNQFAYIASHDLQEPLRTVDNFIDIFEEEYKDKLDEEAGQYFGFIKGATSRMKDLITGLLNYSRLGKSGVKADVFLNELITNIKEDLSVRINERGVVITQDDLPKVNGYPVELRQLFMNLINNAIKFTPPERSPKIHIAYKELKSFHEFKIIDNGLGIKEEHIDKIFNMFTRLHSAKDYEGTGIGLAFCQKIIELHRGKISVTSTLGEGSTFKFTLKK